MTDGIGIYVANSTVQTTDLIFTKFRPEMYYFGQIFSKHEF